MGSDIKISAGEWKGGIWTPRRDEMVYIKKKDRVENQPKDGKLTELTILVEEYKKHTVLIDLHTANAERAKKELLKVLK